MDDVITNKYVDSCTLDGYMYRLRSVDYSQGFSSEQLKQQLVLSYSLIVVTSGVLQLILDHQHAELDRHSIYISMPDSTYGAIVSSEGVEMYIFYFDVFEHCDDDDEGDSLSLNPIKNAQLIGPQGKIMVNPLNGLANMCEELYRKWSRKEKRELFRCQIDFQEILIYIYTFRLQEATTSSSALEAAKEYIEDHYTESLLIEQLAQVSKLSPKYFVDLFKKKYGKSAKEYVSELRLQEAKRLMAQPNAKLREIAHRVGYTDEFYFSRKFKKDIGVSPTIYMNARRRRLVAYQSGVIGYMVALNIMPYAAPLHPKWTEHYYRDYRGEIPIHLSAYRYNQDWNWNIDQLQSLSADIIIAMDDLEDSERNALQNIATKICLIPTTMNWREQLRALADELGESWQAEKWIKKYGHQIQEAKIRLQQSTDQDTFLGLRMINHQLSVYCNNGMASLLYQDLELTPAFQCDTLTYDKPITLEEIHRLNPDHILMLVRQDRETLEHWIQLQNDPQWQVITAVHRKRVHLISSDPWREYSAHAQLRMLEQIVQLLEVDNPSQFRILSMDESKSSIYT